MSRNEIPRHSHATRRPALDTERVAHRRLANVTHFIEWLARERGRHFADYTELWRWSTEHIDDFWRAIWDYFHLESTTPVTRVLGKRTMPGAEWFPGTRLNYAQHILRNEQPGRTCCCTCRNRSRSPA